MDKSIVVINTPKNCRVCPFRQSPWSFCLGEYEKEKHCPLRPLPEKRNYSEELADTSDFDMYMEGWNDCLDKLTGGTE